VFDHVTIRVADLDSSRRPQYGPDHYGAYVLDPDGHNVEAVFHDR